MKNTITNLRFKVPEYDKAKHGQWVATLEWCFDSPQNALGYIQVTPSTNGYLELAHKIAALPLLIEFCEEVAEGAYQDSDLESLLKTLQTRAETILYIADGNEACKK